MEIRFKKIPFEEYLAFFEAMEKRSKLYGVDKNWLKIQHSVLVEPTKVDDHTFQFYCPENICITENRPFFIQTGFKCCSGFSNVSCKPNFKVKRMAPMNRAQFATHLIFQGTAEENHCFNAGDLMFTLHFEE